MKKDIRYPGKIFYKKNRRLYPDKSFERISRTQQDIEEYYSEVEKDDLSALLETYKALKLQNFVNTKMYYTLGIGYISFALGFFVTMFVEIFERLEWVNRSAAEVVIVTSASFIFFTIAASVLVFIVRSVLKSVFSEHIRLVSSYEMKVIEEKIEALQPKFFMEALKNPEIQNG